MEEKSHISQIIGLCMAYSRFKYVKLIMKRNKRSNINCWISYSQEHLTQSGRDNKVLIFNQINNSSKRSPKLINQTQILTLT